MNTESYVIIAIFSVLFTSGVIVGLTHEMDYTDIVKKKVLDENTGKYEWKYYERSGFTTMGGVAVLMIGCAFISLIFLGVVNTP